MINGTFVKVLIGFGLIAILVPNSHKQQTALATVYGNLADDFVETLIEELLPDGAESDFPSLAMEESLLELLVELNDFYLGGGGGENCLNPELSVVSTVFLRRQDLPEYIFGMVRLVFFFSLLIVAGLGGATDENGRRVLDQGALLSHHPSYL